MKKENIYTESWNKFKPKRNKIRSFDKLSLIEYSTQKLHEVENKPITKAHGYLPWYLLFLIKLSFIYGGQKYPSKKATINDIGKLINMLRNLEIENEFLKQGDISGLTKYLRILSFQQFWFQRHINNWDYGLQIQLFKKIKWTKYSIESNFLRYTGISIQNFLELSFVVFCCFYESKEVFFITKNNLVNLIYPEDIIDKYFNLISLTDVKAEKYLTNEFNRIKNVELQIYEETPLVRYPLLKKGDRYYCYSHKLLYFSNKNFIYNYLKEKERGKDSNVFSESFGKALEKYIEIGIKYLNLLYFDENKLKKLFDESKVTDFLISFPDCSLIIESKAVEMHIMAKVHPTNQVLERSLRNSVINAVKQIYSLVKQIKEKKLKDLNLNNIFAFVITYRPLYLGPSQDVWKEFIENIVSAFFKKNGIDQSILDPGNIFYLNIEEFDRFVEFAINNKKNISKMLIKARNDNAIQESKKILFVQHFENSFEYKGLPYFIDPAQELINNLNSKFKI